MKEIFGFPGYFITENGRVWSNLRKIWRRLKLDRDGYFQVDLRKGTRRIFSGVHRLVLTTYVGPCPAGMQCRHLNGIRTDNRLENLCWGTAKENAKDRELHGNTFHPRGEKQGAAKLTERDVRMIVYMYRTGLFLQREIAEVYNIGRELVSKIILRKRWKHIWNT